MKRVLVIGPGGAGKSTMSVRIGEKTGLPVVHLDRYFWRSGWNRVTAEEWDSIVDDLVREPE